jgi:hypothetical protein
MTTTSTTPGDIPVAFKHVYVLVRMGGSKPSCTDKKSVSEFLVTFNFSQLFKITKFRNPPIKNISEEVSNYGNS